MKIKVITAKAKPVVILKYHILLGVSRKVFGQLYGYLFSRYINKRLRNKDMITEIKFHIHMI